MRSEHTMAKVSENGAEKEKDTRTKELKKCLRERGTSLEPRLSRNMETMHKTAKIRTKTIHKEGVGALRGTP